jgi:hypothetical protein
MSSDKQRAIDLLARTKKITGPERFKNGDFSELIQVGLSDKSPFFAQLNIAALGIVEEQLKALLPPGGTNSPQTDGIKDFDLLSVATTITAPNSLKTASTLRAAKGNANAAALLSRYGTTQLPDRIGLVAPGAASSVVLDGAFLAPFLGGLNSQLPDSERATIDSVLGGALGASVSIRNGQPFPELTIAIAHKDSAKAAKAIIDRISMAASSGELPLMPSQAKEVNGVQVTTMNSMFGVGVSVANKGEVLALSTSDSGASLAVGGDKGHKSDGLTLSNPEQLMQLSLNGPRIVEIIRGLQGSLGMFTGGAPLMPEEEINKIAALGEMKVGIRALSDRFFAEVLTVAPKK